MVSAVHISMEEKAFMLIFWILPMVAWVAKAYYAPNSMIRQPKLVYYITLNTNRLGIALPIFSRPQLRGRRAHLGLEFCVVH